MACTLKELVCPAFPLGEGAFLLRQPSLEELLAFRRAAGEDDPARMTCRPVVVHPEEIARANLARRLESRDSVLVGVFLRGAMAARISLNDYNPRNRSAEMGYWTAPRFRGKGYLRRALALFCPAVLNGERLNKLMVQTASFNTASLGLLRSLGFHEDGRLREHHELDGKLYDDVLFSLTVRDLMRKAGN